MVVRAGLKLKTGFIEINPYLLDQPLILKKLEDRIDGGQRHGREVSPYPLVQFLSSEVLGILSQKLIDPKSLGCGPYTFFF